MLERIIKGREQKKYSSCSDFVQRTRPEEDEARALIHAGALDCFSERNNRPALLYQLASCRRMVADSANLPLFPIALPPAPELPPQSHRERLRNQYRVLGFLCEHHPIQFYKQQTKTLYVNGSQLHKYGSKRVCFVGLLLTGKLVSTRTGEVMEFLTFEDETGLVETTFFPKVYRRYAHILASGKVYLLKGLVEEDYGARTMTVESVKLLS